MSKIVNILKTDSKKYVLDDFPAADSEESATNGCKVLHGEF